MIISIVSLNNIRTRSADYQIITVITPNMICSFVAENDIVAIVAIDGVFGAGSAQNTIVATIAVYNIRAFKAHDQVIAGGAGYRFGFTGSDYRSPFKVNSLALFGNIKRKADYKIKNDFGILKFVVGT